MCTSSVSNVIYHKFSHGAAFYTLNGKNVNVMLELTFFFKDGLKIAPYLMDPYLENQLDLLMYLN